MRWKWLLVLSLIAISLVVVSADDDVEKVDKVSDNYDEDDTGNDYAGNKDEVNNEEETQTDVSSDPVADPAAASEDEPLTNEDSVDVDSGTVDIAKQKGRYMNYDDYSFMNQVESSDSSYNWNGE